MSTKLDARQTISRDLLSQLIPGASGQQLDALLRSINADLTAPLRFDSNNSLVVTVNSSLVTNPVSGRKHSIPHIQNVIPSFVSGTITFPAVNGGIIVVSPGSNLPLNCPVGNYIVALVSMDSSGNLVVTFGTPNVSPSLATIPPPVSNTLAAAYITLHNIGGVIQNILQSDIVQLPSSGGGGGTGAVQTGFAQEESVPNGVNYLDIAFPSTLPSTNYVVTPGLVNLVDGSPEFQPITVTIKSTSGFRATWNSPTDSSNYKIGYIVPSVQEQIGEIAIGAGQTNITVTLPITLSGTNYVVIPNLVNIVDASPQFQPVDIVSKNNGDFTAKWNSPTDSANYKLSYRIAVYQ